MGAGGAGPAQHSISAAQRQVQEMIEAERPFGEIEDFIESTSFHPERKTALWLLAWAQQERHVRESILAESLTEIAA